MTTDHKVRRGLRAVVLTTILATSVALMAPAADAAKAPKPPTPAQAGASWMARTIDANDGYLTSFGAPDVLNTAYAVLGLHAAKIGPAASVEAIVWLKTQLGSPLQLGGVDAPGALSYVIMAAATSGDDPRAFGGAGAQNNLVARLLATQQNAGTDAGLFGTQDPTYDGAFRQGLALAAMKAAKVKKKDTAVANGIVWLTKQQCANGLWQSYRADTSVPCIAADPVFFVGPDTNSTGLAVQGLGAWGKKPNKDATLAALDAVQTDDAGFSFMAAPDQFSDPNSTALVIQALVTLGSKPTKTMWLVGDATPYDALSAYQFGCAADVGDRGAYFFPGIPGVNTFATVQSVVVQAGKRLPVKKTTTLKNPMTLPCTNPTVARGR